MSEHQQQDGQEQQPDDQDAGERQTTVAAATEVFAAAPAEMSSGIATALNMHMAKRR